MLERSTTYLLGVITSLVLVCSSASQAHPEEDWAPVHALVKDWVLSLQNSDVEGMEQTLHPDFRSTAQLFSGDNHNLLRLLRERLLNFERVFVKHAIFDRKADEIRVEPLVYRLAFFLQPKAFALRLARHEGSWRVIAVEDSLNIPQALITPLPEQQRLYPVKVSIRDHDSGAPVFSRVHIRDQAGEYWPPAGHMKNFPFGFNNAVGGDVIVDGKRFAYVEPEFLLPLAPGVYTLEIAKGMEYEPHQLEFEVTPESIPTLNVNVKRWIGMNTRGWYSGDTHVHLLSPQAAILEARAEDVNVVNILVAKWAELYTNVEHFIGRPTTVSDERYIVYVNEEARHPYLGHTVLLNLKQLVHPMGWGVGGLQSSEGIWGGHDYPPMALIADGAKRQGGLVSWAHFPTPGAEIAVDFALGKIDAVDLVTWADPMHANDRAADSATGAWYRLLDAGYRVPALGGTDKMFNMQITGAVRTYVKLAQAFSYAEWIAAIRAGRTFTTSGPMLIMTIDGHDPGTVLDLQSETTVTVEISVASMIPVDTIEVVMNGQVVGRKEIIDQSQHRQWTVDLPVSEGAWIAARTYSDHRFTHQQFAHFSPPLRHFAHTSPIYITVDGKGVKSEQAIAELMEQVDQIIDWARTEASFADDDQRAEMLALFAQARRAYAAQLSPHPNPLPKGEGDGVERR